MPLVHWLQLALTPGIGSILTRRLIDAVGDAEGASVASVALLRTIDGIGRIKADAIAHGLRDAGEAAARELEQAAALGVGLLCPDDSTYPLLLRSIPDPPAVLYLKGMFEPRDLNAVAIVGSRKCSFYGREQAERFGALLGGAGVTVVSGGARGIDSAAHRGAISATGGRTIAVLGSGVDITYPPENRSLFEQIAARGVILSEYPLGTPPLADNFPRRNRIVSGISRGVLVIEADERSGALITARQAGDDQGRPVFALPGRVDHALSAGPHRLIRDGATLVTKLEEVLEGLGPLPQEAMEEGSSDAESPQNPADGTVATPPSPLPLTDDRVVLTVRQQSILAGIGSESADVDQLADRTSLPVHVVLQELTFLSLKGQVRRIEGQTYAIRSNERF